MSEELSINGCAQQLYEQLYGNYMLKDKMIMKISIKREQSQTGLSFAEREKFGPKVKKIFQWALAAALICGASVFTSCSDNDDNPATPDLNLSEKIIGKWMPADIDGKPVLTDKKSVYTFVSATKAYMSVSTNP